LSLRVGSIRARLHAVSFIDLVMSTETHHEFGPRRSVSLLVLARTIGPRKSGIADARTPKSPNRGHCTPASARGYNGHLCTPGQIASSYPGISP
jgi:hypothetical protein